LEELSAELPHFTPDDFRETAQEQLDRGRLRLAQMFAFAADEIQELRTMRVQQGWGGDG
jgi:hypothetical protein